MRCITAWPYPHGASPHPHPRCHQVGAWRLRGSKLPLGVDATAHLLEARRADHEWQQAVAAAGAAPPGQQGAGGWGLPPPASGELPLRLRYSLPLVRLVNGISDSQQRGRVASSVAVLSDAAGRGRGREGLGSR